MVARDVSNHDLGVCVASKFLAAGAVVPWAEAGIGAIATQSWANGRFGPAGLEHLRAGANANETLAALLADDEGREHRQVGVVDASGEAAAHTGRDCSDWAAHLIGEGYTCQGNILTGAEVLDAMASAFTITSGELSHRLLAALQAGHDAGGDRRGKQAAALFVVRENGGYLGFGDRLVDLRVDDHLEPLDELSRLLALHELYRGTTPEAEKVVMETSIIAELQDRLRAHGLYEAEPTGNWSDDFQNAFAAYIGVENLEERVDLARRTIDPPALEFMRKSLGKGSSSPSRREDRGEG